MVNQGLLINFTTGSKRVNIDNCCRVEQRSEHSKNTVPIPVRDQTASFVPEGSTGS